MYLDDHVTLFNKLHSFNVSNSNPEAIISLEKEDSKEKKCESNVKKAEDGSEKDK